MQGSDFEAKVAKLVELGFERNDVIQALKLFNGNEEQAAGFLFGGWWEYCSNIIQDSFITKTQNYTFGTFCWNILENYLL